MTVTIAAMILLALQGGMKGLARINMGNVVVLSVSVVAIFIAVMTSVGWDFGQSLMALEPQGTFKLIEAPEAILHHRYACHSAPCYGCKCIVHLCAIGAKDAKTAQKAQSIMPIFAIFFLIGHHSCLLWQVPVARHGSGDCLVHHAGHYGPAMAALASCGVLAASMSTAPTYIMVMSSTAMELYTPCVRAL